VDEITRVRHKIDCLSPYYFYHCNRPDIKVACILDTFSYECFRYECILEQLKLETWKRQIQKLKPHFLFVESALGGIDNSWRNKLIKKAYVSNQELLELIDYCKKNKIITVFWNKEDPIHYPHFISSAKLFDYIFTTDENCIEKYIRDCRHKQVYPLPFAAQPVIHNPVNSSYPDKENVAFAGTWYGTKHEERQADMHLVLQPAKEFGLHIFNRMYGADGNYYRFPMLYHSHIIGKLNYNDMLKAYKLYKVFLNVNSVKNSRTMFSRRVFEILASGTNLVTTYSAGIAEMFGDVVAFTASMEETRHNLAFLLRNSEESKRLSLLGIREVHAQHLYKHRFNTVLEKIGLNPSENNKFGVSVISCLKDERDVIRLIETFQSQAFKAKELVIILKQKASQWDAAYCHDPNPSILLIPEDKTKGDFLTFALKKTKYDYLTFFDPDNYYGPNFLTDIMNAFSYTDADVIGKDCYYAYCEDTKSLALKNTKQENRFVTFIRSEAMIMKRSIFQKVSLCEGELDDFLRECVEKGFKIYSADKYNFIKKVRKHSRENGNKFIAYTDEQINYVTV
jgi:spore maturation protein CgeB